MRILLTSYLVWLMFLSAKGNVFKVEMCSTPEIPFSTYIAKPENYNRNYRTGETITLACKKGFKEVPGGNPIRICISGRWTQFPFECEGTHACRRTIRPARTKCTLECSPEIGCGSDKYACLCDGSCGYSCVEKGMSCGNPPAISNGKLNFTGTSYNDTAHYTCDNGYNLNTEFAVKRCTAKKRWSGLTPRCLRDCARPAVPRNAIISNPRDSYRSGQKVTFECIQGFNPAGMATQMCFQGRWTVLPFKCTEGGCADPGTPKNGRKVGIYSVNRRVYFDCDLGYELWGSEERKCQQNGTWTGQQPVCKVVDCGIPQKPENGRFVGNETTFQSSITYECDEGYELQGTKTRMCTSDKKWSGRDVICSGMSCGNPPAISNGKLNFTGTSYNDTAHYTCDNGYNLNTEFAVKRCTAKKRWSGLTPRCLRDCARPAVPRNAIISNPRDSYRSGQKVTFECIQGFNPAGMATQMCFQGRWTVLPFKCTEGGCGDPGTPKNGRKVGIYSVNRKVYFDCDLGYELWGSEERECQQDGTWTGQQPVCKVVDCGIPQKPENGRFVGNETTFQSSITYECDEGYELQGTKTRMCTSDKKWSGRDVICSDDFPGPDIPVQG